MALIRKLDPDELALLEIVEDPIWLAEFLRTTADGSIHKEEWPKKEFKYRWYQRDIITDKTPFIELCAGRSVGKCNTGNSRIYTPDGYRRVSELRQLNSFPVYAVGSDGNFVMRRARIDPNGIRKVYHVTTEAGHVFEGTDNHPLLTERGYIEIKDLQSEDKVAVVTYLPHESTKKELTWADLRFLGYMTSIPYGRAGSKIKLKYQKQVAEFEMIAKVFDSRLDISDDGKTVQLLRKLGWRAYQTMLVEDVGWKSSDKNDIRKLSITIKKECLDNIQIFLESYFSNAATIDRNTVQIKSRYRLWVEDIQEMLLRFGIESKIDKLEEYYYLSLLDYRAYYRFFTKFQLPGVSVRDLVIPDESKDYHQHYRFDAIKSIKLYHNADQTWAVTVWVDHNYISDNLIVHNSLVLEDKIVYESINVDTEFPETKEQALLTANTAQMTPILDRIIIRFMHSPFLKDFLKGQVNRSKGTLDFLQPGGSNYRINARIAGSKDDRNVVGMHVPKIKIDEVQLFPMSAYTQLLPALNTWERNHGLFICGVPTGLREGNVLYFADQISNKFKKYRVPAHNNPFFTQHDNIESLKQFGGADSEDYVHLVLGGHGSPAYTVIPRESFKFEPFDFYTYRYNASDKQMGKRFQDMLKLPKLDPKLAEFTLLAIDTGFSDPTIIQVFGIDKNRIWRTLIRYRLTRIPFPEQANIIDYIAEEYGPSKIAIDLGSGGGGIGIMQDLMSERFPKSRGYVSRMEGFRFNEKIVAGQDSSGNDMELQAKAFAGQQLAKMIAEHELVFSEIDLEGSNQLERVAYQRGPDGSARYFVMSERGIGVAREDHIFASYVVFVVCLTTMNLYKPSKRLFGAKWI